MRLKFEQGTSKNAIQAEQVLSKDLAVGMKLGGSNVPLPHRVTFPNMILGKEWNLHHLLINIPLANPGVQGNEFRGSLEEVGNSLDEINHDGGRCECGSKRVRKVSQTATTRNPPLDSKYCSHLGQCLRTRPSPCYTDCIEDRHV